MSVDTNKGGGRSGRACCWGGLVSGRKSRAVSSDAPYIIGVLEGEGVGPEVVRATLHVLKALESSSALKFDVKYGGPIGLSSEATCGKVLSEQVIEFCRDVFAKGGSVLAGPGGGRFVYDLRKEFNLFCKISPLKVSGELRGAGRMKPEYTEGVDILVVRENTSGLYQGHSKEIVMPKGGRKVQHTFSYADNEVRRILEVSARIALERKGEIAVIYKDAGISAMSRLWRDVTVLVASRFGIKYVLLDIDYAAYKLVQHARELDVVVAPNLFGDVLSDIGGVLLGSRALTYSGNFSPDGSTVFQTNHGSAYDLVDTNVANPVGQIYSLAMLLREGFCLLREARLIEEAVASVWSRGLRTADLEEPGCRTVGTREMGELIAEAVITLSSEALQDEARTNSNRHTE